MSAVRYRLCFTHQRMHTSRPTTNSISLPAVGTSWTLRHVGVAQTRCCIFWIASSTCQSWVVPLTSDNNSRMEREGPVAGVSRAASSRSLDCKSWRSRVLVPAQAELTWVKITPAYSGQATEHWENLDKLSAQGVPGIKTHTDKLKKELEEFDSFGKPVSSTGGSEQT